MSNSNVTPLFNDRRPMRHPETKDEIKDHLARYHGSGIGSKTDLVTRRLRHSDEHKAQEKGTGMPGFVRHTHGPKDTSAPL